MSKQVFSYNGSPVTFQLGEATMVNATQMAKPFGKRPVDWLRLPSTKEFIKTLSTVRNSHSENLVITVNGGTTDNGKGTWLHEDVALEFARWLSPQFAIWCNDRIKELMRHGITATPQAIDALLNDPDTMIRTLQALKAERERADNEKRRADTLEIQRDTFHSENRRLQKLHTGYLRQLEAQAPKVEYADNVLSSDSTYTTTQIAKELGMSAQALNKMLHGLGIQFRQSGQWLLYAKYHAKGYMKTRTHTYNRSNGRTSTMLVSVWTEAGRMFLHTLLKKCELIKSGV